MILYKTDLYYLAFEEERFIVSSIAPLPKPFRAVNRGWRGNKEEILAKFDAAMAGGLNLSTAEFASQSIAILNSFGQQLRLPFWEADV
jgi:hypothetical protein